MDTKRSHRRALVRAKNWQAGEREASEQIASSQTTVYDSADTMFADLER